MIDKLIESSGGRLLLPIVLALVAASLAKGIFGLYRSKSADRRDFLDLWSKAESQSDLWLEVAVRHLVGTYLPASLIRSLMRSPQAGRALLDVAESWDLLEMHDETNEVHWRTKRHRNLKWRKIEWRVYLLGYFLAMGFGGYLIFLAFMSSASTLQLKEVNLWLYGAIFIGFGLWCLSKSDRLKTASRAMPRWLGLQ